MGRQIPTKHQIQAILSDTRKELDAYAEDYRWLAPWVYSEDRHESVRSRSGHYSPVETVAAEKEGARNLIADSYKRLLLALEDVKSARGYLRDAEPSHRPAEDGAWRITHPEEMSRAEKRELRDRQRRRGESYGEA